MRSLALFTLVLLTACSSSSGSPADVPGGAGASVAGETGSGGLTSTGGAQAGGAGGVGDVAGAAGAGQGGDPSGGAGGAAPSSTAEDCFADLVTPSWGILEVLQFESADGSATIWRARQQIDAPTVGETFAYALVRAWVDTDSDPGICVRDPAALSYAYSHHNWNERWTVDTGQSHYTGSERFVFTEGSAWEDSLTATDRAGSPLLGPLALEAVGCWSLPYDYNVCMQRPRVDQPPPGLGG